MHYKDLHCTVSVCLTFTKRARGKDTHTQKKKTSVKSHWECIFQNVIDSSNIAELHINM